MHRIHTCPGGGCWKAFCPQFTCLQVGFYGQAPIITGLFSSVGWWLHTSPSTLWPCGFGDAGGTGSLPSSPPSSPQPHLPGSWSWMIISYLALLLTASCARAESLPWSLCSLDHHCLAKWGLVRCWSRGDSGNQDLINQYRVETRRETSPGALIVQ